MYHPRARTLSAFAFVAVAAAVGGAVAIAIANNNRRRSRPPDSAPGRTARQLRFGGYAVVGRTVTINKPRAELYAFWRKFDNLPRFMENVQSVTSEKAGRTTWTIAAPAGQTVEVETEIVEERENELIAWRSTPSSQIQTEGRVSFRDAPAGRGTYVEAIVAYRPPGGEVGRLIAKLFQREPNIQGRRELKRFKMLMETGEVATSENRRAAA